jgi:hypothetical protein
VGRGRGRGEVDQKNKASAVTSRTRLVLTVLGLDTYGCSFIFPWGLMYNEKVHGAYFHCGGVSVNSVGSLLGVVYN